MCKIKSGEAILDNEDIRNLVTGVILRQKSAYREEKIFSTVLHYLSGSSVSIDDTSLSKLVDSGLDILVRNGEVSCWNGLYQTSGVD